MSEQLDDQYLEWLHNLVGRQAENVDHYHLIKQLHSREFVPMPVAPSDENRAADGMALRTEFMRQGRMISVTHDWLYMGCSVLEMLIGISRHLSFEMDGEVGEWFWHLVDNLGLTRYHDGRWNGRVVDNVIERLVWRNYSRDGNGGLFPLEHPHQDQTRVELWFQMESYMLELTS
jgi:hypothetical protein